MSVFHSLRRGASALAVIGLATLVLFSILMMVDIAGRELFRMPVDGFSDISDLVVVLAAAACFPASFANKQQVAVRFVGMIHWRLREVLDFLGHLVMVVVVTVIAWQLLLYTLDVRGTGQTTWLLYIPVWPVWAVVTALFALCVPVQLAQAIEHGVRMLSRVPLPETAIEAPAASSSLAGE